MGAPLPALEHLFHPYSPSFVPYFGNSGQCSLCSAMCLSSHPVELVLKITPCTQFSVCERYLAEASSGLLSEGKLFSNSHWPTKHSILNDASQSI